MPFDTASRFCRQGSSSWPATPTLEPTCKGEGTAGSLCLRLGIVSSDRKWTSSDINIRQRFPSNRWSHVDLL